MQYEPPNAAAQPRLKAGAQPTLEGDGCSRLILIEAPSSAYPGGMLRVGNITLSRGGDLMRFSTKQHQFYCGIDLHARTMYLCVLNQEGEILLHRNRPAGPEPFLKAVAPYRTDLVVCVECLFTWYWLADLCARARMPFVLGHALYMKAMHGGKATNDKIDAHKIAVLLRGSMLPHAYVSLAEMRATRDLLRRRIQFMRKRAALLAHIEQTNSQDNLPQIGKKSASTATRDGVAERFPDPAVQKRLEVDLALMGHYDQLRRDVELSLGRTAQHHDPNTLYLRRTVSGLGDILRLVLLDAIHDIQRFPRVQDFVSYCRLVTCAQEAAGKRYGPSGTQIGKAYLTWAFAEAAVLFLRNNPQGQKSLPRLEKTHGKGTACTVLAQKLARAVYPRLQRHTAFDLHTFLQSS
jgi:transposase